MTATQADRVSLRRRLEQDYLDAMKARQPGRLSALRMLKASVQSADKSKGSPLTEDELVGVVTREVKLRRESIAEFERGNRPDLVLAETEALDVLTDYLPPQLSDEDIRALVRAAVSQLPATADPGAPSTIGLIMRSVMPQVKGRAEGERVRTVAGEYLARGASA